MLADKDGSRARLYLMLVPALLVGVWLTTSGVFARADGAPQPGNQQAKHPPAILTSTPTPTASSGGCTGTCDIAPGTTDTGSHCDDCVTNIALPFPFSLYGQSYTQANLSSNGNLQLVTNNNALINTCLPATALGPALMVYWDDLRTDMGIGCSVYPGGCGIYTSISGTAPNRMFNIEWRAAYFNLNKRLANFEIRLYEGQGRFTFVYGQVDDQGMRATVGVQDGAAQFLQYECNVGGITPGLCITFGGPCDTPTPTFTGTPPTYTYTPTPTFTFTFTRTPTTTRTFTTTPVPCSPTLTWGMGQSLSPARYAVSGALVSDNNPRTTPVSSYYVVGGLLSPNVPTSLVSRYNPITNSWIQVVPLPQAAARMAVGGSSWYLYAAGGYIGGSGPGSVTSTLRIYTSITNLWTFGASMPQPVEAAAGTILDGKLYVMGGDDSTNTLATNYIYDIGSNTWTMGAPLPSARKNAASIAIGGRVYLFGGLDASGQTVNNRYIYDPVANTWTTLVGIDTGGRGNLGGIVPFGADSLLLLDGGDANNHPSNSTHILDPVRGWIPGPPLNVARMGMALGALTDGRIITYGGLTGDGTSATDTTEMLPYAPPPCPTFTATPTPTCAIWWNMVNSPSPGLYDNLLQGVAALSANDVWAVGYYFHDGSSGQCQTLTLHWDGTQWSMINSPSASSYDNLNGVAALSANDVWAVGHTGLYPNWQTLIEHWDGTQWSLVLSPNPGLLNNLQEVAALSANDVWAVGYSRRNGLSDPYQTLTLHWDGTQWSRVPSPNPGLFNNNLNGVAALSANDVWAVGYYSNDSSSGHYQTLTLHWDGTQWSWVPSPSPGLYANSLNGVAALSANDVWAVGYSRNTGSGPYQTLTLHWDGTQWSWVPSPSPGSSNSLNGVAALSANDVWAVGSVGGGTLTQHWNGSEWSLVPSPNPGESESYLYGVAAVSANDVWAVGTGNGGNGPYRRTLALKYPGSCIIGTPTRPPRPTATTTYTTPTAIAISTETSTPTDTPTNTPTYTPTSIGRTPTSTSTGTSTPTLTRTRTPVPTCTVIPTFTDVSPNDWFHEYVLCLYCRGAISGYADGTFRPYANTTRGQLTKIIVLAIAWTLDCPSQHFSDIPPSHTFFCYVETAYEHGIITGYGDGTFRPGNNVTRGQVCKIVVSAMGWPTIDPPTPTFRDVPRGSPFYVFVETAVCHQIVTGYADDTFRPGNPATRAQICKIVCLALRNEHDCTATPTPPALRRP